MSPVSSLHVCRLAFFTLLAAFLFASLVPAPADAYPRKVLAEIFMNTGCPLCGPWVPPVERLIGEYSNDTVIQISWHTWWPQCDDPYYRDNHDRHLPGVDDIMIRVAYYGYDQFLGVPSYFFDGFRLRYHNPRDEFHDEITELIDSRFEEETPLAIEIAIEVNEEEAMMDAEITVSSDENLSNLILFTALCEIQLDYDSPSGQDEFLMSMIEMYPDAEGVGFRISENQLATFEIDGALDLGWRENPIDNLSLVVWVQNEDLEVMQVEEFWLGRDNEDEPTVLVVDASDDQEAGTELYSLFGEGELPNAHRWVRADEGELINDDMIGYQTILWHSFNCEGNIISETEEDALVEFLEAGGTLVMTGCQIGNVIGGTFLYQRYLGAQLDAEDLEVYTLLGSEADAAFDGLRIELGDQEGGWRPTITPSLAPVNGGEVALYYASGDENEGAGAIINETDQFRTLTLAFPVESIVGSDNSVTQAEFLERVWEWVERPHSVGNEAVTPPPEFRLDQVYPNPFNDLASISFSLDFPSTVRVDLFNLSGRRVANLLSESLTAGAHSATIDAGAIGLSGGVYIAQLQTERGAAHGKVVYLK